MTDEPADVRYEWFDKQGHRLPSAEGAALVSATVIAPAADRTAPVTEPTMGPVVPHEHTTIDSDLVCEYIGLVRMLQHFIATEPDKPVSALAYYVGRVESALEFSEQMNEAYPLHHLPAAVMD